MRLLFKSYKQKLLLFIFFSLSCVSHASSVDELTFDDRPLDEALILPDWFKLSFLEIASDIEEAKVIIKFN